MARSRPEIFPVKTSLSVNKELVKTDEVEINSQSLSQPAGGAEPCLALGVQGRTRNEAEKSYTYSLLQRNTEFRGFTLLFKFAQNFCEMNQDSLGFKPRPNDRNSVGRNLLCVFGHPAAKRCDMLCLVHSSLKRSKFSQQHPTPTSQQGGQTHSTCCIQQSCDRLEGS